jgi:hypothetical protein
VKHLPFYLVRSGLLLLALSVASYLIAIWEPAPTAERFGLTGVTFMSAGLTSLVVGGFMTVWREGGSKRADRVRDTADEDRW